MVIYLLTAIAACVLAVVATDANVHAVLVCGALLLCLFYLAAYFLPRCLTGLVGRARVKLVQRSFAPSTFLCGLLCLRILRILLVFIASLYAADYQLQRIISAQLPPHLEGKAVFALGYIASVPERDGAILRFHFDARAVDTQLPSADKESKGEDFSGRLRLSWKTDAVISIGQQWRFQLRLKRPRGLVNPQGFDYQAWLLRQNLSASGYILQAEPVLVSGRAWWSTYKASVFGTLMQVRAGLSARLDAVLFAPESGIKYAPIIKALLVGDKQGISTEQWQLFQQTGTVHLMAISGLHIGMVAGVVMLIMRGLTRPLVLILSPLARKALCVFAALSAAFIYSALAGFSLPTVRAFTCLAIMALAYLIGYRPSFLCVLLGLAGLILLLNPMNIMQIGFVLSFSAVAALIFAFGSAIRLPKSLGTHISTMHAEAALSPAKHTYWVMLCGRYLLAILHRLPSFIYAQWVMLVALLPCMLLFHLPVSVLSPLANSVAIPIFSVLILPVLLLSLVGFSIGISSADSGFVFADILLGVLLSFLQSIQQPQFILPAATSIDTGVLMVLAIAVLMLLSPRALHLRGPALLVTLVIVHWVYSIEARKSPAPRFAMTVLDVGQGLSIVGKFTAGASVHGLPLDQPSFESSMATPADESLHWHFVYDIGAKYSAGFSIAERIVLPYLRRQNMAKDYMLMISHADNDHAGAFDALLKLAPPLHIYSGEPDKLNLSVKHQCLQGSVFVYPTLIDRQKQFKSEPRSDNGRDTLYVAKYAAKLDQAPSRFSVQVLWPPATVDAKPQSRVKRKANNQSCVVLIRHAKHTILLTGDIEVEVERRLLASGLLPSNIDVLIAPHHGSATSSSYALLNHLRPEHVVFSAGYKNRYRHPAEKIVERYRQIGTTLWRTAEHGAISIVTEGDQLHIQAERCVQARRWFLNEGFCRG